jgi:ABC-type transport system involved in multi-copper enzyme maturation permease subunit
MMPFLAILRQDLAVQLSSWLVRIWLAAAAVLTLLLAASAWPQLQTAPMIALLLFPWLVFPWFVVVMVLGVTPISGSRAEALADGFLSRPITRHEYLLAIWASRVAVVLGTFLLVMVPAVCLVATADRAVRVDPVTLHGTVAALAVVALVLVLQVSLGFLMGTLLRRPLPAIVALLFLWYPVNLVLHTFKLEALSPISLSQAIPALLREPRPEDDSPSAESAKDREMEELSRQTDKFLSFLSGSPPPAPARPPGFFERDEFRDFSLANVLLGYGIPTLAAIGLATLCFCRRDL